MIFDRYELNDNELILAAGGGYVTEVTEKLGIWYPFKNDETEKTVTGLGFIPIP